MPRFIVDLWLDGYDTEEEMIDACEEFIYEQLNFSASNVKIEKNDEDRKMTNYLKTLVDQEFTSSEQLAILVQMADAVGDGRKYEIYREPRNGKNVLMVRVYNK